MDDQTKNMLLAGLGGVAVGTLIGILFAPAEGKKTRAAISGKAEELTDKVSSLDAEEILEAIQKKLQNGVENTKDAAKDELLERIEKLEEAIKKA